MTAFGTAERTDVLLVASQEARELYLDCPRWRWIERARLEADPGFEKRYLCIRCAQAEAPDAHVGPAPGALEEAAKRIGMGNAIAIGSMAKRTRLGDFRPEEIDGL